MLTACLFIVILLYQALALPYPDLNDTTTGQAHETFTTEQAHETFEQRLQSGRATLRANLPAAVLLQLETYQVGCVSTRVPARLPDEYPDNSFQLVMDPTKRLQYSVWNSPRGNKIERDFFSERQYHGWRAWTYPDALQGWTYERVLALPAVKTYHPRLVSLDVGVTAKDPFRGGQPGQDVFWIFITYSGRDLRLVVEPRTGQTGLFTSEELGLGMSTDSDNDTFA